MTHSSPPPWPADPAGHRRLVQGVFDAAATRYDLMNDVMSLGLHRPLKRLMVDMASIQPHHRVLDIAAGTGDLTALVRPMLRDGEVVALDANPRMLALGRDRLLNLGLADVDWVCARAEHLPFADAAFDRILIGFGLRNFSDKECALREICRCLRPGGRLLVLELSQPTSAAVRSLYDKVSERALPALGSLLSGSPEPYRYLHDSIRRQPPPAQIAQQMLAAGFARCDARRLLGGIFSLHIAQKG